MDNKNVFVAIALAMSVLLFWEAFLELQKKLLIQKIIKKLSRNLKQAR